MPDIDATTRAQIAVQLEHAIIQVLEIYLSYSGESIRHNPERFLEDDRMARRAQAHFLLLIKALDWAGAPDQVTAEAELAALTREAQAELAGRE